MTKTVEPGGDTGASAGDDDDDTGADDDDDDDDDDDTGDDDDDDTSPGGIRFDAHVVAALPGVKFTAVGDLDGDGTPEIVAAAANDITERDIPFGLVSIFTYDGDLDSWTEERVIDESDGFRSPNQPTLADLDGDGDLDIVVAAGSRYCEPIQAVGACGLIFRLLNDNGQWDRQLLTPGGNDSEVYTSVDVADIDGDGNVDVVTAGEVFTVQEITSEVFLFRGNGDGTFNPPASLGSGLGPWVQAVDIDNDGDLDLMSGERTGDSFAWMENNGSGQYSRHLVSDNFGDGFMMRWVDDLYGDGVPRVLASNHTNTESPNNPDIYDSQLVAFEIPSDPTGEWITYDKVSDEILPPPDVGLFPFDSPGTFDWGDADGDGDLDILLAGDGDTSVYLLDQTSPGQFTQRVLRGGLPFTGGTVMADFTGDGAVEFVVASAGADTLYVIERTGG